MSRVPNARARVCVSAAGSVVVGSVAASAQKKGEEVLKDIGVRERDTAVLTRKQCASSPLYCRLVSHPSVMVASSFSGGEVYRENRKEMANWSVLEDFLGAKGSTSGRQAGKHSAKKKPSEN